MAIRECTSLGEYHDVSTKEHPGNTPASNNPKSTRNAAQPPKFTCREVKTRIEETDSKRAGSQIFGPNRFSAIFDGTPPRAYVTKKIDRQVFHCWLLKPKSGSTPKSLAFPIRY